MNPATRRALHQALDLILDALAEEGRESAQRRKPALARARALPPLPPDTTAEDLEEIAARLGRRAS